MSNDKEKNTFNIPFAATTIIDDCSGQGVNNQRSVEHFKRRYKKQMKEAVRRAINDGSIKDIADGNVDREVDMPADTLEEFIFHKGKGGVRDMVHPGNDQFKKGDIFERPPGGGGGGSGEGEASDSGEGEDDFKFIMSKEEYLDLLFEDLELPFMELTKIAESMQFEYKRAGFTSDGVPERLNAKRTVLSHKGRNIAMGVRRLERTVNMLKRVLSFVDGKLNRQNKDELDLLLAFARIDIAFEQKSIAKISPLDMRNFKKLDYFQFYKDSVSRSAEIVNAKRLTQKALKEHQEALTKLLEEVEAILARKKPIAKIDEKVDGRYANLVKKPKPAINAVMFCLMDVSGSMDQETKDLAKRFYIVLYLFLHREYIKKKKGSVEVVFIRHHTQAKEVDEEEFFYGQETGGTIASSAVQLMQEIQQERFPYDDWNVYAAQASDGDNFPEDNNRLIDLVKKSLDEGLRYYMYVEITGRQHQRMWHSLKNLSEENPHVCVGHVKSPSDIVPVFKSFFKKK